MAFATPSKYVDLECERGDKVRSELAMRGDVWRDGEVELGAMARLSLESPVVKAPKGLEEGGKKSFASWMLYTRLTAVMRLASSVASASTLTLNVGPMERTFGKSSPGIPNSKRGILPERRDPVRVALRARVPVTLLSRLTKSPNSSRFGGMMVDAVAGCAVDLAC